MVLAKLVGHKTKCQGNGKEVHNKGGQSSWERNERRCREQVENNAIYYMRV